MTAAGLRAPVDCDTVGQIAHGGDCFLMTTGAGECVAVIRRKGSVLWLDGVAATRPGQGVIEAGFQLAEQIAKRTGCTQIAFETQRRGLVRESKKTGFAVAGYIMKKAIE